MTRDEILYRFPNASPSFIKANVTAGDSGLCAVQPQPVKRLPLDLTPEREETRWHDADASFEIVFTVYSVRPCDWDGYDIKHLQDWLVSAGFIPGDGWEILSGRCLSRKAATKAEEKTVVEITEITQ